MVDDIDAARQRCVELDARPSSETGDLIHSWFHTEPSGRTLQSCPRTKRVV
jgi:hypothetical protein